MKQSQINKLEREITKTVLMPTVKDSRITAESDRILSIIGELPDVHTVKSFSIQGYITLDTFDRAIRLNINSFKITK